MKSTAECYLHDLGYEVHKMARDAQSAAAGGDAFEKGRQMAFYEVVSLMYQQARAFDIGPATVGLPDANPDDLLR